MAKTRDQIIGEIDAHMAGRQYGAADWYVGIASDPSDRLFNDHNVDKRNGIWIYQAATSADVAREVEQAYLDEGYDGGSGGGDANTKSVYAYVKLSGTIR